MLQAQFITDSEHPAKRKIHMTYFRNLIYNPSVVVRNFH